MASTAASVHTPSADSELSLLRLNIMRAIYFLIAFGEGSQVVPALFATSRPRAA